MRGTKGRNGVKKRGKEEESDVETVLFVPHTPGGILAKMMQEEDDRFRRGTAIKKIKMVERGGTTIKGILGRTNPWSPYCHATILPCHHTAKPPYCHAAILPRYHTATLPYCHATILPRCHTARLPYCHTTILPCHHTTILPCQHTAKISPPVVENSNSLKV